MGGIEPSHAVVWDLVGLALPEVDPGIDHRRQRCQRQYDSSKTHSEVLLHRALQSSRDGHTRRWLGQVQADFQCIVGRLKWNSNPINNLPRCSTL